jgi:hypothetical protein
MGLICVARRRVFRIFLLLGLVNFLLHFAIVYFMAQIKPGIEAHGGQLPPFLEQADFGSTGKPYRDFISAQSAVVMLLLGFAGSVLVGNDFRHRAVAFYLSKPISKVHYFLGKLAATAGLTALITLLPALVLYAEYGAFTESFSYYLDTQHIFWAIVAYGVLVSVTSGVLLLGVSATLQRTIPTIVVWGGIFVLLPLLAETFRSVSRQRGDESWYWGLLDFWALLRWTSNVFFGIRDDAERLPWVLLVLSAWMAAALWGFWRRVRAVDVVG